jgi:hypothetical protein
MGHVYDQVIGRALQSFQDYAASHESRALRSGRPPGVVLATLNLIFRTPPRRVRCRLLRSNSPLARFSMGCVTTGKHPPSCPRRGWPR